MDLKRAITGLVIKPRDPSKEFVPRTLAEIAEIVGTSEQTVSNCISSLKKMVNPDDPTKLQLSDIVYKHKIIKDLGELVKAIKDDEVTYDDMSTTRQKIYFLLLKQLEGKLLSKTEIAQKVGCTENNVCNAIHTLSEFAKNNSEILAESEIKYVGKQEGTFQEFLEDLLA